MYQLLIVDDEPLTREFFKNSLSSINAEWECAGEAADGTEAVQFLENHQVDLIITDIRMPVMDGIELCRQVKVKNPDQEIVILSGYDEFSYAQQAIRFQVDRYLLKPIKIPALQETLEEASGIITKKHRQEVALSTLKNLSIDYKNHICRSYLKAIIENFQTEIKVLHPMLFKLKIDLMQAQGMILILRLDAESILLQKLPGEDLPTFQYVLFQTAFEVIEKEEKSGFVILDSSENTIVYLTGDNAENLEQKCASVYARVLKLISENTGLTITGFAGCAYSDILEMVSSYHDALKYYDLWAVSGDNRLYSSKTVSEPMLQDVTRTQTLCVSILNHLAEHDEVNFNIDLNSLLSGMSEAGPKTVLSYLLLLLQYAVQVKDDFNLEQYILYLQKISAAISKQAKPFGRSAVHEWYAAILHSIWNHQGTPPDQPGSQKLVEASKEFIYQHFSEPITLSQIADHFSVSPNYLSKIFHESAGESYIKFITRVRMKFAAKLLLSNPEYHVFTIAEKAGYYNLKHFNFVFKEYYGMTPTEYQNSKRKSDAESL